MLIITCKGVAFLSSDLIRKADLLKALKKKGFIEFPLKYLYH